MSMHVVLRRVVFHSLRTFARLIFRSADSRQRVADFVFRHSGSAFARLEAYRYWQQREAARLEAAARVQITPQIAEHRESVSLEGLQLPHSDAAQVSVVIPVYNNLHLTEQCLASIARHPPKAPIRIIVVDDASTDSTAEKLGTRRDMLFWRNEKNLGFLASCNQAVMRCDTPYVFLLNNDTEVREGWLDSSLALISGDARVGLVGSKLVFPNGYLQEAGGIIWNDANGSNFGRDDHPDKPGYNYVRDADYCSGAAILFRHKDFISVGGFDTRFLPAYYEDTDFAFQLRERGLRVLYNPFSVVVHFEGGTSGTDLTQGPKAHQVTNKEKFLHKWRTTLATHGEPWLDIENKKDRACTRRALVVDWSTPTPDKDSGSIDTFNQLIALQRLGYQVSFAPDDLLHAGRYTEALQKRGIECLYAPWFTTLEQHLLQSGQRYDLVILKRLAPAMRNMPLIRKYCPDANVIFDTVDLHFLRMERQAEIEQSPSLRRQAELARRDELSLMVRADATIVISEQEAHTLTALSSLIRVFHVPYSRDIVPTSQSFAERQHIVFVGGYRHAPNIDAVYWFAGHVWPLIRTQLPDAEFHIVGSDLPAELAALDQQNGIRAIGFVADLDALLATTRLTVAPLRYGAGIKGKVGSSLAAGVPVVMTPVAAEGMYVEDGVHGLIAAEPAAFADAVVRAYSNATVWQTLRDNGLHLMSERYGHEAMQNRLRSILEELHAIPEKPVAPLSAHGR